MTGALLVLAALTLAVAVVVLFAASDAVLPHRPRIEDEEEQARPFPRLRDGDETVEA